jgi:predicted ribosome quality control (RQC) complex YloA/Tae2 family protein
MSILEDYSIMSLQPIDALTLAAVTDELRTQAFGARVEDVVAPTPQSVALQLYAPGLRGWLLASAHPQLARVHLLAAKPRKLAAEPSSFVMLLRKHLEGARLVAVRQPTWERVLELGFARGAAAGGPVITGPRSAPESAPGSESAQVDFAAEGHSGATWVASPVVWLVVEMMGRLSNLILRDETGMILGALTTMSTEVNAYRAVQPHVAYRPPPPQTRSLHGLSVPRLPPDAIAGAALHEAARDALAPREPPAIEPDRRTARRRRGKVEAPTVASLLAGHVAGWSRELGREVSARALGRTDVALGDVSLEDRQVWDALAAELRALAALTQTHTWRPTLVRVEGSRPEGANGQAQAERVAFAFYETRQYAGAELVPMPSANSLLAVYFEGAEWRVAVEGAKGSLRQALQTQRERCARKEHVLRGELAALDEAARLRAEADILLAFQTEVPPHASSVTLPNPFADGDGDGDGEEATITLALDPRLSAVENANRRYHRYHKLKRAAGQIPLQIEANRLELARIAQLTTDLDLAETTDEIAHVRRELAEAGYLRGQRDIRAMARAEARLAGKRGGAHGGKQPSKKGGKAAQPARRSEGGAPIKRQSADGFALLVGKNSRQNEEVTFHQAAANDLWLHARGVPGAHVIVKSGGRPVPEATIHEAAALAAFYSQSRAAGSVPVDVTDQRYVRHMKGGGPGMVTYERERTLHVAPADSSAR